MSIPAAFRIYVPFKYRATLLELYPDLAAANAAKRSASVPCAFRDSAGRQWQGMLGLAFSPLTSYMAFCFKPPFAQARLLPLAA